MERNTLTAAKVLYIRARMRGLDRMADDISRLVEWAWLVPDWVARRVVDRIAAEIDGKGEA
jgi:hypothetical protein